MTKALMTKAGLLACIALLLAPGILTAGAIGTFTFWGTASGAHFDVASNGWSVFTNRVFTITAIADVSTVHLYNAPTDDWTIDLPTGSVTYTIAGNGTTSSGTQLTGSGYTGGGSFACGFMLNDQHTTASVGLSASAECYGGPTGEQLVTLEGIDVSPAAITALASYTFQGSLGPLGPEDGNWSSPDWWNDPPTRDNTGTAGGSLGVHFYTNLYFQASGLGGPPRDPDPTPEPACLTLFASGIGGLLLFRRLSGNTK